jgi:acetyl-CoA carboxylase carboxyl transferase subunit alpha
MERTIAPLEFEEQLYKIEDKITELKNLSVESGMNLEEQIETLTKQALEFKQELYANLKPSQKLQIARHPMRPNFLEYTKLLSDDFIELHGDRAGSDDRAIIGGLCTIQGKPVMLIGTQKGKNTKENLIYNFGMPQPEGYRKALRLMYHAERFNLPIVTLIDTPGAYPGIKAEETGQGIAIAVNLAEMAKLTVPIIAIITGEGCSGGALGLAVSNKVYMLEHSYYTVISPEGCASILYRSADRAADAADALKITAKDLMGFNIVDGEIAEPLGGAHYDHELTAKNLSETIINALKELSKKSGETLKKERYEKFRNMGVVQEL